MSKISKEAAQATLLKALANNRRLQIMSALQAGECTVGELAARFKMSQSSISQHLSILRRNKLVRTRREAQTVYYSTNHVGTKQILATLEDVIRDRVAPSAKTAA